MKLLHTSDWHLGMTFRNGMSFIDDQRFFINEIIQIAQNENVDAILIAGDIFDRSIAPSEAIGLFDETMTEICGKYKIPVFIIAGNHDGAYRLASCSELLKESGLYIAGALTEHPRVEHMGDTDIYMLPWISTDKVKSIYPESAENIQSLEDAYRVVLDKFRDDFDSNKKHVLLTHAFVNGAETSVSDKAAEVGTAAMIGLSVFEGFDYVALGHLHGPQQFGDAIRYSGTPMAYSFGNEEKQEKSVTIIDTASMDIKTIPVKSLHKRTTLKGKYDDLKKAGYPKDVVEGYVRLELEDCSAGLEVIATFREIYKNLLEVSGKSFENSDAKITMTIDEFEDTRQDPEKIFARYCEDMMGEAADDHKLELFRNSLKNLSMGGDRA